MATHVHGIALEDSIALAMTVWKDECEDEQKAMLSLPPPALMTQCNKPPVKFGQDPFMTTEPIHATSAQFHCRALSSHYEQLLKQTGTGPVYTTPKSDSNLSRPDWGMIWLKDKIELELAASPATEHNGFAKTKDRFALRVRTNLIEQVAKEVCPADPPRQVIPVNHLYKIQPLHKGIVFEQVVKWATALQWNIHLRPDVLSYSATLAACSRETQWQAAVQVIQDMSLMSIQNDAICRGAALRALSRCFRWRHALILATSSTATSQSRPLEVLEVIAACQGASKSGLQQLLPLRSRLLMLRPHVTLTGRCQGEGEAGALAQSLSDHGLLYKATLGLHMGIRAQLEGRDMARRGPLPAGLPSPLRLANLVAPAAQFLRTWLAFQLCLGGCRISSPGLWVSARRAAAAQ
eukprot:s3310_g6.t1